MSYSQRDQGDALRVRQKIEDAGISVFDASREGEPGAMWDNVRKAIADSEAVIIVISRNSALSSSLGIEIGAAIAWQKPVYVVLPQKEQEDVPELLRGLRSYTVDSLSELIDAIIEARSDLTNEETEWLKDWYEQRKVPLDRIVRDPESIALLTTSFHERFERQLDAQKLLLALLRLRKRGELPKLTA